jgi:hypothetical protein
LDGDFYDSLFEGIVKLMIEREELVIWIRFKECSEFYDLVEYNKFRLQYFTFIGNIDSNFQDEFVVLQYFCIFNAKAVFYSLLVVSHHEIVHDLSKYH